MEALIFMGKNQATRSTVAVFGYPLLWLFEADTTFSIQFTLGYIMLGLIVLSILTGLTKDIQRKSEGLGPEA